MSTRSQRIRQTSVGGHPSFPTQSFVGAPVTGPFSQNVSSIGGEFAQVIQVTIPSIPVAAVGPPVVDPTVSVTTNDINLTSFPSPFTLNAGSTGSIIAGCSLASAPLADTIISLPIVQVIVGSTQLAYKGGAGTPSFALSPGTSYNSARLSITITAFNASVSAAINQQTVSLLVWALLVGRLS